MKFNQKGQALIEAIVALSAAALTVSVVTILVLNALGNTSFAKAQTTAAAYAKQGLEYSRTLRDQNFSTFTTSYAGAPPTGRTWCLDENSFMNSGNCASGNYIGGTYKRELNFSFPSASCDNGVFVTSSVAWTDSQCSNGELCHNVALYSCLSNNNALSP